jgi:hypothetical protein
VVGHDAVVLYMEYFSSMGFGAQVARGAANCVLSRVVGSSFDLPPLSPFSDWFHALAKI